MSFTMNAVKDGGVEPHLNGFLEVIIQNQPCPLNKPRRSIIKPSFSPKFANLAGVAEDSAKLLFGDNKSESLDSLTREDLAKYLLNDKASEGF